MGDALVEAQGGDGSRVRVRVLLERLPAQGGGDVLGEDPGLADGVLGVGRALSAGFAGGDVGDGGGVAGGPGVFDPLDGEPGGAADPAARVQRQVGGGEEGAGRTPAVQTTVRVGSRVPSLSTATRSSQESRRVSRRTSTFRARSSRTAYRPIFAPTSGRIRSAASTRTQRRSAGLMLW